MGGDAGAAHHRDVVPQHQPVPAAVLLDDAAHGTLPEPLQGLDAAYLRHRLVCHPRLRGHPGCDRHSVPEALLTEAASIVCVGRRWHVPGVVMTWDVSSTRSG